MILLKNVRLSYPYLFQRQKPMQPKSDDDKGKFAATFILDPVEHEVELAQINTEIQKIVVDKLKGVQPAADKLCLKVGDDLINNQTGEPRPENIGKFLLRTASNAKPAVVDQKQQDIAEEDNAIYGGCYVNANVSFWGWSHPVGGRGVSCNLHAVQLVREGEAFGNVVTRDEAIKGFTLADAEDLM